MSRDIAIIGLAGRFPNSADVHSFWHNIINKVECVTNPPPQAWDMEAAYDASGMRSNRIYTKKGGFLGDLATFNPLKHSVTPNSIEGTEPAQWLALEIAREAFDAAGFGKQIPQNERTAVIIGRGTYINRANQTHHLHGSLVDETMAIISQLMPERSAADLELVRADLQQSLPPFDPTSAQGLIPNIIAGRIANKLDLMGPAYTVDAACASSVVAVEQAVKGLRNDDFDMALVGGSYIVSPAPMTMVFAQLQVLSRRGEIAPFSADSDGTVLGEGIGMVLLKRLDDALRDGDPVYATIKGVGTASDGSGRSVIAPRLEGALLAMRRAFADAQIEPSSIGLIEAHGLGTPVGDAVELDALHQIYGDADKPIALGTVKPMTGHLMPASGVAGLIKATLALHQRMLPPTLHVNRPNPQFDWQNSALQLNGEKRVWHDERPLRAAVNSFGFGGVTAHLLLEAAPVNAKKPALMPTYDPAETGRIELKTNTRTLSLSAATRQKFLERDIAATATPTQAVNTKLENDQESKLEHKIVVGETEPIGDLGVNNMTAPNGMNPLAPAMMAAYTDLMKTFLNVQRDVMIAALNGSGDATSMNTLHGQALPDFAAMMPVVAPVAASPVSQPQAVNGNGQHGNNGRGAVVAPVANGSHAEVVVVADSAENGAIQDSLVAIVADRTGYPPEMIELDLDLEADLGIDSIKRVEILSTFQKQHGDSVREIDMEDLAERKSLREIIELVAK